MTKSYCSGPYYSKSIRVNASRQLGFTLIEVLLALVIVGITLPALSFRVTSIMDTTGRIDDKTTAFWVAEDTYQRLLLERDFEQRKLAQRSQGNNNQGEQAKKKKRTRKTKTDSVKFSEREWYYEIEYSETENERFTKVDVKVGLKQDFWLATISGFLYD